MGRHVLGPGKELIEGLRALGEALGYHVETDQPLLAHHRQELDVAWFGERGQQYPLMIFEVESAATNAAAANPTKVFGKPNEVFEKPLFFFHIFLRVATETTRIDDLRGLFGTHNYRIYHLTPEAVGALLYDVLAQHRRIRGGLDLEALVETLRLPCWAGADVVRVARSLEPLRFNGGSGAMFPAYLRMARTIPTFWPEVLRVLREREAVGELLSHGDEHVSYIGRVWPAALYIGILAAEDPQRSDHYLDLLREWQEQTYFIRAIGPNFGLSRDHDEFLIRGAAAYWAIVASLFREHPPAVDYIAEQLRAILHAMRRAKPHISFYTALWALHVGVEATRDELYDLAREVINGAGGAPAALQLAPPSICPESDLLTTPGDSAQYIPTRREFAEQLSRSTSSLRVRGAVEVARDALAVDSFIHQWSGRILTALH